MSTLKQPKLGQTILALRQEKKITQEELVERCNVNVRTLQRIEAGEVTPRESTLRIILEALDYDFQQVEQSVQLKSSLSLLKIAWIGGIFYFVSGVGEFFLDLYRFDVDLPIYFPLLYTTFKIVILAAYVIMMLGYVEIGKLHHNTLIKIGAYLMLSSIAIIEIYDVISLHSLNEKEFMLVKGIEGVAFGGIDILFGIALFRLGKALGDIAKIAGLLEIVAGVFFLTFFLGFFGIFVWMAAILLEIVILYKVYDKLANRQQTEVSS